MIERVQRIIKNAVLGVREVEKEKAAIGTHIFRPLYNGEEWYDWMVEAGVPSPKTAEELKVSILQISGQFQLVPDKSAHVHRSETCVFGVVGGKLAAIWYEYGYYDRHWGLRDIIGYDNWCNTSRAMLVLSDEPGDFTFSDDALLKVPANIALAGERSEVLEAETVLLLKSAPAARVTPTEAQQEKAKTALAKIEAEGEGDPFAMARLYEITKGVPLVIAEAETELGADLSAEIGLSEAPEVKDVRKTAAMTAGREVQIVKRDNERQNIYGWASVSTVDGELYTDLHGDTISVDALHDACTLIVRDGQNLGGIEHEETPNFLAAAVVIDDDFAAAMSDTFYFGEDGVLKTKKQGLFMAYHVADKEVWDSTKDNPVEFSLNATAFIAD